MHPLSIDSPSLSGDLSGKTLQFMNAQCLRGKHLVIDHVWVKNRKIINAADVFYHEQCVADIQIDCKGLILSPGFIDVQINGGFGFDFSQALSSNSEYEQGVEMVSHNLLSQGVTSYAPTLITSSSEIYRKVLPLLFKRDGGIGGAGVLGAHLEGPFICKDKKGCHPSEFVCGFGSDPENTLKNVYGSFENIAIVTLAPELPGCDIAIRTLVKNNIVVSLGHSSATLKHGEAAIKAGASCITHLFNAMAPYHHRGPGLIGLLASNEISGINYGMISDGIHSDDSALRIAYRTCPDGLILVTDAIAALGMCDGEHRLGAQTVVVEGLHAFLKGTQTTAGSVASMPFCVKHFISATNASVGEALYAATKQPAQLLSLSNKGNLDVGSDADFVLLNDDLQVQATFIGGQRVFSSSH
ncbi:unnamed protein product [Auanema sp. JU1783]|nr:unnamed protein product [Auanema sp. JU1783]